MKRTNSNQRYKQLIEHAPELSAAVEDAQLSIDISMQIYKLRTEQNLSQKQLAALARIQQSNISRLESPGYQSYTIKVLSKVVRALGAKLQVEIIKTSTITERSGSFAVGRNKSSIKLQTASAHQLHDWSSLQANIFATNRERSHV